MKFKKFLHLDLSRCLGRQKIVLLLIFYLFAAFALQFGISQYKKSVMEAKHFDAYESARFEELIEGAYYSMYGFNLLNLPGPSGALFCNSGIIQRKIDAFIDGREGLSLYESVLGKKAFVNYSTIYWNLTGWLFLSGSLLSLFYGIDAFKDKEFLRFLVNTKSNPKEIFGLILLTRLLFLMCIYFVMGLVAWLLYMVNDISFPMGWLLVYFFIVFLMAAFFLLLGMIAGALADRTTSIKIVFAAWLLFTIFLPAAVGGIAQIRAEHLESTYKFDLDKLKLLLSIERKSKEIVGTSDLKNTNAAIRPQLYEYFWKNEFQETFRHEQAMIDDMKEVTVFFHSLSSIFPTSFFLSVNNEITGRGYLSLIAFYEHCFKHKIGFIKYYAEKSFSGEGKTVKPYLQGKELVFYGSSLLPGNFGFGVLITFFWLLALGVLSWVSFNRFLTWPSETSSEPRKEREVELKPENFKPDKTTIVLTENGAHITRLMENLRGQKMNFVRVPQPESLPEDVTIKRLLNFFELDVPEKLQPKAGYYMSSLSLDEKAWVLFIITKSLGADFFIFNNYLTGLSDAFIDYFAVSLGTLKKGRKLVYFSNSMIIGSKIADILMRITSEKKPFL